MLNEFKAAAFSSAAVSFPLLLLRVMFISALSDLLAGFPFPELPWELLLQRADFTLVGASPSCGEYQCLPSKPFCQALSLFFGTDKNTLRFLVLNFYSYSSLFLLLGTQWSSDPWVLHPTVLGPSMWERTGTRTPFEWKRQVTPLVEARGREHHPPESNRLAKTSTSQKHITSASC